jgi:3-hydroxyisobutyrate dehydrogenase
MTQTSDQTVAFLGIGQMGTPMAKRLIGAGFALQVWDQASANIASLVDVGAKPAATPAEATKDADFVITMLPDGAIVESVMTGEQGALSSLPKSALWLQMSTVGVDWTATLHEIANKHDVAFLDAPVSGSVAPATSGTLVILAGGPSEYQARSAPVFQALGRIVWLGDVGAGSAAKLVLNNWLADIVEATVEMLRFSAALGLDPHAVVDLLDGLPIGSPYGVAKARQMLAGDFAPSFALKHALKDVDLSLQTAKARGVNLLISESFAQTWHRAIDDGLGDRDVSAVFAETSR